MTSDAGWTTKRREPVRKRDVAGAGRHASRESHDRRSLREVAECRRRKVLKPRPVGDALEAHRHPLEEYAREPFDAPVALDTAHRRRHRSAWIRLELHLNAATPSGLAARCCAR